MAQLIDGKMISAQIKDELKEEVAKNEQSGHNRDPGSDPCRAGSRLLCVCAQ